MRLHSAVCITQWYILSYSNRRICIYVYTQYPQSIEQRGNRSLKRNISPPSIRYMYERVKFFSCVYRIVCVCMCQICTCVCVCVVQSRTVRSHCQHNSHQCPIFHTWHGLIECCHTTLKNTSHTSHMQNSKRFCKKICLPLYLCVSCACVCVIHSHIAVIVLDNE